jgi:hypothetical protein
MPAKLSDLFAYMEQERAATPKAPPSATPAKGKGTKLANVFRYLGDEAAATPQQAPRQFPANSPPAPAPVQGTAAVDNRAANRQAMARAMARAAAQRSGMANAAASVTGPRTQLDVGTPTGGGWAIGAPEIEPQPSMTVGPIVLKKSTKKGKVHT